jgi:hypothetical protein
MEGNSPCMPLVPELEAALVQLDWAFERRSAKSEPTSILDLVRTSANLRFRDSGRMLRLAREAVDRVDRVGLASSPYPGTLADVRALAWINLANSLRIAAHWEAAEEAFRRARHYCGKGRLTERLQPRLHRFEAALRGSQGEHLKAIASARDARQAYFSMNDSLGELAAGLTEAVQEIYSLNPGRAKSILLPLARAARARSQPLLALLAHHNLVRAFLNLHQPEEAIVHLVQAKGLYRLVTEPLVLLKAIWQEGVLLFQVGHKESADRALRRAQRGFEALGQDYEAHLVMLERAGHLRDEQRQGEAIELGRKVMSYFEAHGPALRSATTRALLAPLGVERFKTPNSP